MHCRRHSITGRVMDSCSKARIHSRRPSTSLMRMGGREPSCGIGLRSFTAIVRSRVMTFRIISRPVLSTNFRPEPGRISPTRVFRGGFLATGKLMVYSPRFQGGRSPYGCRRALNAPGNTQTADQVKPVVEKLGGIGPGQPFFDPSAFAAPVGVRFGTSGRNILRGPGVVNLDLGVFRRFPIREQFKLEFRAEASNFTNTPHFNNPSANVSAANFLVVTSAVPDQRQVRLGLRLSW